MGERPATEVRTVALVMPSAPMKGDTRRGTISCESRRQQQVSGGAVNGYEEPSATESSDGRAFVRWLRTAHAERAVLTPRAREAHVTQSA